MIIKIFSTVAVVILGWLAVQSAESQRRLSVLEQSLSTTNEFISVEINQVNSNLKHFQKNAQTQGKAFEDMLTEYVELQRKSAENGHQVKADLLAAQAKLKTVNSKLQSHSSVALLNSAYQQTLEAELLFQKGQSEAAATLLLGTKSAIWKSSSTYPDSKDKLRGLMGPIDGLAGKWKRNDKSGNTAEIRETLQSLLKKYHSS